MSVRWWSRTRTCRPSLGSPEFFDVDRYPQIFFRSTSLRREGDDLIVDGELTIKGNTRPVEGRGTINGPAVTLGGAIKLGLVLETVVDRTEFGLNWNAPLPRAASLSPAT